MCLYAQRTLKEAGGVVLIFKASTLEGEFEVSLVCIVRLLEKKRKEKKRKEKKRKEKKRKARKKRAREMLQWVKALLPKLTH
jgi:Zn-dependent peptidase ImmA (M78 family)